MRTANKNKQKLYYSLYEGARKIYERDRYGNIKYITIGGEQVPVEVGEVKAGYHSYVEFLGNIALSGGEAEAREYGLNLSDYSATLVTNKGYLLIDETSRIWTKEPVISSDGLIDGDTADYTIVKVSPSLNQDKFILAKVVK